MKWLNYAQIVGLVTGAAAAILGASMTIGLAIGAAVDIPWGWPAAAVAGTLTVSVALQAANYEVDR